MLDQTQNVSRVFCCSAVQCRPGLPVPQPANTLYKCYIIKYKHMQLKEEMGHSAMEERKKGNKGNETREKQGGGAMPYKIEAAIRHALESL